MKKESRIGVLDGLRVLMIALVANFHIWQQSWWSPSFSWGGKTVSLMDFSYSGFLFVDGLILLSGFLLFYLRQEEPVDALTFYGRRFRRIVPSYELAVLLSFFLGALPRGLYGGNAVAAGKDLIAHVTFLQMFFRSTYLYSPLNGALWTLVVEAEFYLLFPLLARAAEKKPVFTLGGMGLLGWAYRFLVCAFAADTAPLVNQFPAYLDVFALGMAGAMLYRRFAPIRREERTQRLMSLAALAVFVLSCWVIVRLVLKQTASVSGGYEQLRRSQMTLEFPFALAVLAAMLSACAMPKAIRFLLDNRLARFLSGISMNFYIWHQLIAVRIREYWFPSADTLHADGGMQTLYTLVCWLAAFAVAMLITYGVEKPAAAALKRFGHKLRERHTLPEDGRNQA